MNRFFWRRSGFKLILTLILITVLSIDSFAEPSSEPGFPGKTDRYIYWHLITSNLLDFTHNVCSLPVYFDINDQGDGHKVTKINKKLRKRWIRSSIDSFYENGLNDSIPNLFFEVKEFDDFYQKSIRLESRGMITFPENSWLYLVAHSGHDDPGIGDITLAIDELGNVYMNEGHICGGIIHFIMNHEIPVNTANDFIENFRDDTEDMSWKNIRYRQKNFEKLGINKN